MREKRETNTKKKIEIQEEGEIKGKKIISTPER